MLLPFLSAAVSPPLLEGDGLGAMFDVGQSSAIWTVVIFLIALPFMWKLVFGPIVKALEDREDASRGAAREAEEAKDEAQRLQEAMKSDLDEARREAAAQVAVAKSRAEEREKELMASARAEAEKERVKARADIDQALASARETLRQDVVELGMDAAEKVIGRSFAAEDRTKMLADLQEDASL